MGNTLAHVGVETQYVHPGWQERILGNLNVEKERKNKSGKKTTKHVKTPHMYALGAQCPLPPGI